MDIITCTESIQLEITKSIIIKCLVQVDRSVGLTFEGFKKQVVHFYRIEAQSSPKSEQFWLRCIRQINIGR